MGGKRRVSRIIKSRVSSGARLIAGVGQLTLGTVGFGVASLYRKKGIKSGIRNIKSGSRGLFARRVSGTGSGGAQNGHEFYGNQYTKVAKYSRGKTSGGKRRLSTWKGQ